MHKVGEGFHHVFERREIERVALKRYKSRVIRVG